MVKHTGMDFSKGHQLSMTSVCVSYNLLEEAKTEAGIPKPLHFHTAEMHVPPG